jgi:hypothetical protein
MGQNDASAPNKTPENQVYHISHFLHRNQHIMPKTLSTLLLSLAVVLWFASCAPHRLCYNQSPDFNEVVEKVYITAESVVSIEPFAKHFVGTISTGLSRRGVENEVYFHDALSLKTEREVQEHIQAYGAKWHLDIRQREQSASGGDFSVTQSAFDLRLFDREQDRIVWRASLFGIQHNNRWLLHPRADFPCGTGHRSLNRAQMDRAERISAEIIAGLAKSGIIP